MAHLYTWRGETPWKQYGPGEERESGRWWCSCPEGRRHHGPRIEGKKPSMCRHLSTLFGAAREGKLSGHFRPTRQGLYRAANCRCSNGDSQALEIAPPPTPPPAPIPGQPSKNRPCPCGSGTIYKWCEGTPGAPHARGAWPAPAIANTVEAPRPIELPVGAKVVSRIPWRELPAEERSARIRLGRERAAKERAEREARLDKIFARIRREDLERQAKRKAKK